MRARRPPRRLVLALTTALAAALLPTACGPPPFVPGDFVPVEEGDPGQVAAVLFLVGDAGLATVEGSPLLHRLRDDVEAWSARLPADSSVAVLFLGDNVYPEGLRDRDDEGFPRDSAHLASQVWVVSGPEAHRDRTRGMFVAGNHDWGNRADAEGLERLTNETRFLADGADGGPAVSLVPRPGSPGPQVVELGDAARLVLLDTDWWIQDPDSAARAPVVDSLARALAPTDGRPVVVAAHHPIVTGGPHGRRGLLDPFRILARTGALVQDLGSPPYQALRHDLADAFRRGRRPLVYAAGHDHSLQVIRGQEPDAPGWTLVSGAGSKTTRVTDVPGMTWADAAPGYMRLLFRKDGRVDLFVERTPERYASCGEEGSRRPACMGEGLDAFATAYSVRLK